MTLINHYNPAITPLINLARFAKYGRPAKTVSCFGGAKGYYAAVKALEDMLYEAV